MPAGCLLIRYVFFSGLLQNMSRWHIVCIGKGMWDFDTLSLWTLDLGIGRLRLKQRGPIYVWMGRPKAHFCEAYNGGPWPMIYWHEPDLAHQL